MASGYYVDMSITTEYSLLSNALPLAPLQFAKTFQISSLPGLCKRPIWRPQGRSDRQVLVVNHDLSLMCSVSLGFAEPGV